MPENIKQFSDIKLKEYHNTKNCKNGIFKQAIKGNLSNTLFAKYADNLRQMMYKANKNQQSLLTILNELFVYTINPQTNKRQIRISPKLTEITLQKIVVNVRALIIKLYLTCEIDYQNGINIYKTIVEKKLLETSENQIKNLKQMSDVLMDKDDIDIVNINNTVPINYINN